MDVFLIAYINQILILGAICVIVYLLTLFFTRSKSLKFLNR